MWQTSVVVARMPLPTGWSCRLGSTLVLCKIFTVFTRDSHTSQSDPCFEGCANIESSLLMQAVSLTVVLKQGHCHSWSPAYRPLSASCCSAVFAARVQPPAVSKPCFTPGPDRSWADLANSKARRKSEMAMPGMRALHALIASLTNTIYV